MGSNKELHIPTDIMLIIAVIIIIKLVIIIIFIALPKIYIVGKNDYKNCYSKL